MGGIYRYISQLKGSFYQSERKNGAIKGSYSNNQFYKKSQNLLKYGGGIFFSSCNWGEVEKKGEKGEGDCREIFL